MDEIFISYRRDDSDATVGRIYDRLKERFGKDAVFRDKNVIPYGREFPKRIREALERAVAMLVIIGPAWLSVLDEYGNRRLDMREDWVRREVVTALKRSILIIPVLVQGAKMPDRRGLPPVMAKLADKNAIPARGDPDFDDDMKRLIVAIMAASPTLAAVTQESPQSDQGEIAEDGEDPDELVSAGRDLVDLHPAQAVSLLKRATQLDPHSAEAWEGLGDVYWNTDLLEDALNAYSRSLALAPENPDAWYFTARILHKLGHYEEALTAYDRALSIAPTDAELAHEIAELWYGKAGVLRAMGRYEEAVAAYGRATPNLAAARAEMGEVLAHLKRHDEAVSAEAENAALAFNPDDVETLINQADVLLSLDAPELVLDVCYRAVALHPGDARVWELMARILRVLGLDEEAEVAERRARARGG